MSRERMRRPLALGVTVAIVFAACSGPSSTDLELRRTLELHGVEPLVIAARSEALVALGESLFFDKELSGNRDISCASCHHPTLATGDGLSLPIGTGGVGLGSERLLGEGRNLVPRNSPEIFNRGASGFTTMFWDGRVAIRPDGSLATPAGDALPAGIDVLLAAQAMFPPSSHDEMRGEPGDLDVYGKANELATVDDSDLPAIWDALAARLSAIPDYVAMFAAAYPDVAVEDLGFEHAARAIAAYESAAFAFHDSPFDRYLAGDDDALTAREKRGARLFYDTGCAFCHSGSLLSDQSTHVLAVPQIGPGKGESAPDDVGRFLVTGNDRDRHAFRTPPLRNVAITGPWMHDGVYTELETAVRHMLDPVATCLEYESGALGGPPPAVPVGPAMSDLDPLSAALPELSDAQVEDILAFLNALTDPAAEDLAHLVPDSVPSGLPVDR